MFPPSALPSHYPHHRNLTIPQRELSCSYAQASRLERPDRLPIPSNPKARSSGLPRIDGPCGLSQLVPHSDGPFGAPFEASGASSEPHDSFVRPYRSGFASGGHPMLRSPSCDLLIWPPTPLRQSPFDGIPTAVVCCGAPLERAFQKRSPQPMAFG
jgi:hypothetical protein